MSHSYNVDLEKITLDMFHASISKRNMIPSRIALKENIGKTVSALSKEGIKNLKDVLEALKTKQKIEGFSKKTKLSEDCLTLLKREVKSYLPKPVPIRKFPDIDSRVVEKLEKRGIKHSKQFFEQSVSVDDRKRLSKELGISVVEIDLLYELCDLARLYGVGPIFARILHDGGIHSVRQLLALSPKQVIQLYEAKTHKKADFTESDIKFTLEIAAALNMD